MTLTMALHITFPAARGRNQIDFYRATMVQIESSWKEFTDRAEITMPRNVRSLKGEIKYSDIFKSGDPVIIRLGYGAGELPTEFTGYISDVSEGIPVVLRCEDEMYQLKRGSVSVVSGGITLKNLLKQACKGYEIDCPDMQLGAVRQPNKAPIEILEWLKKEYKFHSYFDGDKMLHCFSIWGDQSDVQPVDVLLERNAVSESLNRKNANENVEITLTSINSKGKKVSVTIGTGGGTKVKNLEEVRNEMINEVTK